MNIINIPNVLRIPIKNWASHLEGGALEQAINMANLPCAFHHIALMPDAHQGIGVCIGGVLALNSAICPNAIGVDIGCGMCALKTNVEANALMDMAIRRQWVSDVKTLIPTGDGRCHSKAQEWQGFDMAEEGLLIERDRNNLYTLGGGNHFCELQKDEEGNVWIMIHSGSRNLGHRIANFHHLRAQSRCMQYYTPLPNSDLAFFPFDTQEAESYWRHMQFALSYAKENRKGMMDRAFGCLYKICESLNIKCDEEMRIDVHHNYASIESHFGKNVIVHRKGATSAKKGELCIIPGSMGTASYICKGKGNIESFMSCSHGAGRKMSRNMACMELKEEECDRAMAGVVYDRWRKIKRGSCVGKKDLSEAPGAYKNIDEVIANESDLVSIETRLTPLAVVKG